MEVTTFSFPSLLSIQNGSEKQLLVLAITVSKAHLTGLLLIHGEIDSIALGAQLVHRVANLNMYESHLPFHLCQSGTDSNLRLGSHDALTVFHLKAVGDTAGLQLAEYHPRGALVDKCCLNTTV